MSGWIKLHRQIQDCWIWEDKPFSKGQAWIDLLLLASHKEKSVSFKSELITIERGSFITSELKLMERWGWSKSKTRLFLNMLEKDSMIIKKTDRKKTTITIVNYSVFQNFKTTEESQKDHSNTTQEIPKDTNKNINSVKKDIVSPGTNPDCFEQDCKAVVDYLNLKLGTNYHSSSRDTRKHISARFKEGWTPEDFYKVIDVKCAEWNREPRKGEKDMRPYLRPSTLFGTKFEEYLNQKNSIAKNNNHFNNFPQRKYNFDELESKILDC